MGWVGMRWKWAASGAFLFYRQGCISCCGTGATFAECAVGLRTIPARWVVLTYLRESRRVMPLSAEGIIAAWRKTDV